MNNVATTTSDRSVSKTWLNALQLTASITDNPHRLLATTLKELAEKFGEAPALLSVNECLTYRVLHEQADRYSRWALNQGLTKGDVVCLLMQNRPEYMAIWLGITRIGAIVSLLNTNLTGSSLAHCIQVVEPKHIIVDAALIEGFIAAVPARGSVWSYGPQSSSEFPRIDTYIETCSSEELNQAEYSPVSIHDTALYIYTSGTTGLPKAAKVSHFRLLQWSYWFSGMMGAGPEDRMYNCLPMYHSVGGVVATGAVLVSGGSVVVREKFSARQFWDDIVRWECTLFQYIGELCRYLLHAERTPAELQHRIRMCCGNGLRGDIWNGFKDRFQIPAVLEFYAATEGTFSLFNIEGKPGAIGRIPPFLAHRFPAAIVKFDTDQEKPIRDEQGLCIRCSPNEAGEAIGKILAGSSSVTGRFEGYTNTEESEKKILHNVFEPGDRWFRTGDLMRKDERGYFYFVDRVGDTFRWKGENVATSEVSEAICTFPGIKEATVYGVVIPNTDGRAGMAAVATDDELDLRSLRAHLSGRLPPYALPVFLRIRGQLQTTATFKHTKNDLMRDGYDPSASIDPIYFYDPEQEAFVLFDEILFARIKAGHIRL